MSRVINNCGECGWRERDRDKHADQLDHFCGHPTTYDSTETDRARRRRLHIVSGEEWEMNNEQGWPQIPAFCPLASLPDAAADSADQEGPYVRTLRLSFDPSITPEEREGLIESVRAALVELRNKS